jgi:hypothetical protein
MNDPDCRELWRDALNDVTPDAIVDSTLASTLAHARRVRRTRSAFRLAASATVLIVAGALGIVLSHAPIKRTSTEGASPALTQAEESKGVPVHYLTDEELLARFPGQPVGLVGSGSSSQFIGFTNTPEK